MGFILWNPKARFWLRQKYGLCCQSYRVKQCSVIMWLHLRSGVASAEGWSAGADARQRGKGRRESAEARPRRRPRRVSVSCLFKALGLSEARASARNKAPSALPLITRLQDAERGREAAEWGVPEPRSETKKYLEKIKNIELNST